MKQRVDLLACFLEHPDRVPRGEPDLVWGMTTREAICTVDVHVAQLRRSSRSD
jgi:DNA-binding response OmpR family regulator